MRYNIGDQVWVATTESKSTQVECPVCFGKLYITLTLGDGSQHTHECEYCKRGFDGPFGVVQGPYIYTPKTWFGTISSIRSERDREEPDKIITCYTISSYILYEENLFDDQEAAYERAVQLAWEHHEYSLRQFEEKPKPRQSYSYNVGYAKEQIKRAEKEAQSWRMRLNAMAKHVKESK